MDPLKRPRGRPPLAANKRKYELLSHVTEKAEIAPKLKAVYHPPPPIPIPIAAPRPILMPTIVETKISIPKLSQPADQGEASGGKSSARNHYPVQRVLNKLLIEDPMTILSIGNALPDIPKDTLQATLDILQVLGYVIKVKTGTSSKDKDVNALFTTSNYAKSSEPAEVMQMATLTEQKWRNSELTKKRIQALHVRYHVDTYNILLIPH